MRRYLHRRFPASIWEEREWLERAGKGDANNIALAIDSPERMYIGNIGLHDIGWIHRRASLGIVIGEKEYWGRGLGGDAVMTMLHYAFTELNLRKVELAVLASNDRALRCYKRCGFQVEGVKREQVFANGEYHDVLHMAVFRGEWMALYRKTHSP